MGVLFFIVFLVLFFKDRLGIKERNLQTSHKILTGISTFLLGIYGGFFGGGFGTFMMFLLVIMGFSFIKSAAISRVVGFLMSLSATIVFAQQGLIHYLYGIALGAGFAVGGWIGIGIALKKGDNYVKRNIKL